MIEWLTEARLELKHHLSYIHRHNPTAAIRIEAEIMRRVDLLEEFPMLGAPGRQRETRELVVVGTPYIVIYLLSSQSTKILHVVHGAQKWPPDDA